MRLRNVKRLGGGKTMMLYCAELTGQYEGLSIEFCVNIPPVPHLPFTVRAKTLGSPQPPFSWETHKEMYNAIERYFECGCDESKQDILPTSDDATIPVGHEQNNSGYKSHAD
jgi:hypothetical protein